MLKKHRRLCLLIVLGPVALAAQSTQVSFAPGDVFVSLETGPVQWRLSDGTLRSLLVPAVPGWGEGMAFDSSGNLYVARWRADSMGLSGNTVEKFNVLGQSLGAVGRGYDCDPHAIVFDWSGPATGTAYVGQAGCRRSVLKFVPGSIDPIELPVAEENQGAFWIDLAPDRCTLFYTSYGASVKRYDACSGVQLSDFNAAPLPGGLAQDLRVLADGGVLVSSSSVIVRLSAAGLVTRTYEVPGEGAFWAGLDLVGDGTFWAANYFSSNVYRFDLESGAVLARFNTDTPPNTAVGVRVKR